MKTKRLDFILIFSCFTIIARTQCSFEYISNDTVFQDHIEFIHPKKNANEIITIGSRINRGLINDTVFNAPVFQIFDYCANILTKTVYNVIEKFKLNHKRLPFHQSYLEEPIGNTAIAIDETQFLIVDKAIDTISNQQVLILFRIDDTGQIRSFKTLNLNSQEANQNAIKNVLKLKDGRFLVILTDNIVQYDFYYFDAYSEFLYKKSFNLGRGIRSIVEIDNNEFICSSNTTEKASFQFYRIDTSGQIKWIVTPYTVTGSAREILIEDAKIYIVGGSGVHGVFMICDFEGNTLKEFIYDSIYCKQRFCSAYIASDSYYYIGGYIQHCDKNDKRGQDICILKMDPNGKLVWNKTYDFRNELGTSGNQSYYTDFGGFMIRKTNDGGIITNGMSKYFAVTPGIELHEDALLIKTEAGLVKNNQITKGPHHFELTANIIQNNLNIIGPTNDIKKWVLYNLQGASLVQGSNWSTDLEIGNLHLGVYVLNIMDQNNCNYYFKFIKMK